MSQVYLSSVDDVTEDNIYNDTEDIVAYMLMKDDWISHHCKAIEAKFNETNSFEQVRGVKTPAIFIVADESEEEDFATTCQERTIPIIVNMVVVQTIKATYKQADDIVKKILAHIQKRLHINTSKSVTARALPSNARVTRIGGIEIVRDFVEEQSILIGMIDCEITVRINVPEAFENL